MLKSGIIYFGGKYKLLSDILKIIPKNITAFHDVFAGAFNVGCNVNASTVYYNDINKEMCRLVKYIRDTDTDRLISEIDARIDEFGLTPSSKEHYLKLRECYNETFSPLDLYILHIFSFCHGIRFNTDMKYNMPVGNGFFNDDIRNNLIKFSNRLKQMNIKFSSYSFNEYLDNISLSDSDVLYFDPPYLISQSTYNSQWGESDERLLYSMIDNIANSGNRFILSNVFYHKGNENEILKEFSSKYKVIHIKNIYTKRFCNSNTKKSNDTDEVIVTNISDIKRFCIKKLW